VLVSLTLKNSLGQSRSKACDSLVMYLILYNLWTMFHFVLVSASYGELKTKKTVTNSRQCHANSPNWFNTVVMVVIGRIWILINKWKLDSCRILPCSLVTLHRSGLDIFWNNTMLCAKVNVQFQKISIHVLLPQMRLEFPGGRGFSTTKTFKEMY